ncbi:phosphatase 2C-like domain-containing protein [Dunaliella salina]|uniref:Protein phosphatase n=1 Tax=Dunaliella salina TaxID=3046 RepID=A0ABQ7G5K7_DUNSA|nr:phosphatase 2C-like domain-containing protein [Dunaliella salina]|eukprot:KAF5829895.1 phosphatase 2C-like domain-containing protein [Dunaliella salina]
MPSSGTGFYNQRLPSSSSTASGSMLAAFGCSAKPFSNVSAGSSVPPLASPPSPLHSFPRLATAALPSRLQQDICGGGKQQSIVLAPPLRMTAARRLLSTSKAAASPVSTSSEEGGQGEGTPAATQENPQSQQAHGHLGPYALIGGAYVLPHPEKMGKGGEDWFFVSDTMRALGVADGVGGWAEVGVDAGAYARQLMANAKQIADTLTADGSAEYEKQWRIGNDPTPTLDNPNEPALQQTILEKAYAETKVRGSSTASIVVLANKKLFASNLGDSGFMIIRDGQVVFHSPSQQHGFNFPFQIGSFDSMSDSPTASQKFSVPVQLGDVIVLGTDGLWDNCFDEEITAVIKYCVGQQGSMSMDKVAQVLAFYARHRASDPKYASPFAYAAFQADLAYMGGKLDDITVVVARVAATEEVASTPVPGSGGFDFRLNPVGGSAPASKL